MQRLVGAAQTTIVGGAIFLIPLVVVVFFGSKLLAFMEGLIEPVVGHELKVGGVAVTTMLALLLIALLCYFAGLWARTPRGRGLLQWAQRGIAMVIPSFGMYNELLNEIGGEGSNASVVLVPTDAGWTLAITFDAHREGPRLVFIPGAPQWTEGSLALAPPENVRATDLTVKEMIGLLRQCGRSSNLTERLAGRFKAETPN